MSMRTAASHYGNFRLGPVTGQTRLRITADPMAQANSGVLGGAQQSNHRQGWGQHKAQFLVGVAQRIFDELG
jgi:hypothetical protein